jgi:hypothetical protein
MIYLPIDKLKRPTTATSSPREAEGMSNVITDTSDNGLKAARSATTRGREARGQ